MPKERLGKKDLFTLTPISEKDVKTPKRQNVKTLKRLSIKTLKPPDTKTLKLLRRTIYFTEELWEGIRKEAFEKNKDYSEVVREVVERFFKSQPRGK
jgi:hypothetical protein